MSGVPEVRKCQCHGYFASESGKGRHTGITAVDEVIIAELTSSVVGVLDDKFGQGSQLIADLGMLIYSHLVVGTHVDSVAIVVGVAAARDLDAGAELGAGKIEVVEDIGVVDEAKLDECDVICCVVVDFRYSALRGAARIDTRSCWDSSARNVDEVQRPGASEPRILIWIAEALRGTGSLDGRSSSGRHRD